MALRDQCSCSSYAALSLHSIPAPIIPEVARRKVSSRAALSDENNENNNNKNDKNICSRRSFGDFVSMASRDLADLDEGIVEKAEHDVPETTSLVFQGLTVSCIGESCSVCDEEGCRSFDNASTAFAAFLTKLPHKTSSTFLADRDSAMHAMNAALVHDDECALDSGSEVHLLTPEAAHKYFSRLRAANLRIIGVTGVKNAKSAGDLILSVVDQHGVRFSLRLGVAYAMDSLPMNLLSVSQLCKQGTVLHFERGNSWLKHPSMNTRVSIEERGGLFVLPISQFILDADRHALGACGVIPESNGALDLAAGEFGSTRIGSQLIASLLYGLQDASNEPVCPGIFLGDSEAKASLDAYALGASATISDWHRRLAHKLSGPALKRIWQENLVDGYSLKGNLSKLTTCGCMACRLAKARRRPSSHDNLRQPAVSVGERVSTDIKDVNTVALGGYRYCCIFVDEYSGEKRVYSMKRKNDLVDAALRPYLKEMQSLGHRVQLITSDRGSNYFSNNKDGETRDNGFAVRLESKFSKVLQDDPFHRGTHKPIPVESHEKRAESAINELFQSADAMLFDARLSAVLWPAAVSYAAFISNRIPCLYRCMTPYTVVTGKTTDWSKLRVFGSSVVETIPNDNFKKTPGVARGRHRIFVGFAKDRSGYLLFDPISRSTDTADSCVFYENFSDRIDSLRHFDKRREMLKKGIAAEAQPIVIDEFSGSDVETVNRNAVRDLYLDPDEKDVRHLLSDEDAKSAVGEQRLAAHRHVERLGLKNPHAEVQASGDAFQRSAPLSRPSNTAAQIQEAVEQVVPVRPLRTSLVGKEAQLEDTDLNWLWYCRNNPIPVQYLEENPKKPSSASWVRFEKYKVANTLSQALSLGSSWPDIKFDYSRGYIRFPKNENGSPGHIFRADSVARSANMVHVMKVQGLKVHSSTYLDNLLARCFMVSGQSTVDVGLNFQRQLETVFEAPLVEEIFEDALEAKRYADSCMRKVLWSDIIDLSMTDDLPPEPFHYKQTLAEYGCRESEKWAAARRDEDEAMKQFGAYKFVPASEAEGYQVMGSRYVYKRKIGKDGNVSRWKARMVVQGLKSGPNAQDVSNLTAGDLYAPTLHKDSLRLLLSLAAGQNYSVFQADIQNAFLQGTLKTREFIRPPDGMVGVPPGHLLECLVPVYGLRQAPARFVQALSEHLTKGMGFRQLNGDPCVYINEELGCFIGAYIDDLAICVKDPSMLSSIMSQLRERFTIKEGEGAPVDWLLGMRVRQNLDEGYISIDQELAISKLAKGLLSAEEMKTASSVRYPMLHSKLLPRLPADSPDRVTDKRYFHMLSCCGSLLHIANSVRCDVASSVGILCRHAASYGEEHIKAAKRIIRYLYATRTFVLVYRRGDNIPQVFAQGRHPKDDGTRESHMRVFVDSDFAMDETRRSTMGSVTLLNGAPVSWTSTLGKTVATSTCEAEINAAVAGAKDAIHLRSMLRELGVDHGKIFLHEDNSAAISQGAGGLRLVRNAKHYAIKLRWLQQVIADDDIGFVYTPTKEQLADCFTKPNDEDLFLKFRKQLVQDVSLLN